MTVRVLDGSSLLGYVGALRSVYAEAFCGPPWNEDTQRADAFTDRLRVNARRPGFTAMLAERNGEIAGFATAWTTPAPFPTDRCYRRAAAALGAAHTARWLCGAREVDELAVRPAAHGAGLGTALLEAVTADAPGGRSWLLTSARSPRAVSFYRRQGWTQATHPSPAGDGVVVFLGPHHPAKSLAVPPL